MNKKLPTDQPGHPIIVPLSKWAEFFPDPSEKGLRWLVFINKNNFNEKCVLRRGRRILIHVDSYFEWLLEQQQQ
jgi:hypothetical protein